MMDVHIRWLFFCQESWSDKITLDGVRVCVSQLSNDSNSAANINAMTTRFVYLLTLLLWAAVHVLCTVFGYWFSQ